MTKLKLLLGLTFGTTDFFVFRINKKMSAKKNIKQVGLKQYHKSQTLYRVFQKSGSIGNYLIANYLHISYIQVIPKMLKLTCILS